LGLRRFKRAAGALWLAAERQLRWAAAADDGADPRIAGVSLDNEAAYAQGLLTKALDPSTQPPAIRAFLEDEVAQLWSLLRPRSRVVDFGCGMGRHLLALNSHLGPSVGFDYEAAYIKQARQAGAAARSVFFVADATAAPLLGPFDAAICLTNTWGTMRDKLAVLNEMRRLSPSAGTRFVTVYSPSSVAARREWYANMGHRVLEATDCELIAEGGFSSEHFSERRLRSLLGPCELHPIGNIAYLAQF
jgi:SAM-dependent methyltransferase